MTISTGLDRRSAIALALMMPLGPLCIAALRAVMPTFSSTDANAVADAVAAEPGRQSAVIWLGCAALLLLVPGVLGAAALTRRAAPRLTWWATVLLVPAYLMLGAMIAGDMLPWSAHAAGQDAAALYEHQHPAIIVATVVFVIGHVVGTVLLGLALLKARQVPAVLGWALAISQPLHFIAFVVLGIQPLDVIAWLLTTVGMAAAGVAVVRAHSDAIPQPATRVGSERSR